MYSYGENLYSFACTDTDHIIVSLYKDFLDDLEENVWNVTHYQVKLDYVR